MNLVAKKAKTFLEKTPLSRLMGNDINENLLLLAFFISAVGNICISFKLSVVNTYANYLVYSLFALVFIIDFIRTLKLIKYGEIDIKMLAAAGILTVLGISSFIVGLCQTNNIIIFKKVVFTLFFVYLVFYFHRHIPSKESISFLLYVGFAFGCLLILSYAIFSFGKTENLTLNQHNPNYTGMLLAASFACSVALSVKTKNRILKLSALSIAAVLLVLTYFTSCRSVLIALVIGSFCCLFFSHIKDNKTKAFITVFLPLFIVEAYLLLYYAGWTGTSLNGKSLNTRVLMWDGNLQESLFVHPFGRYGELNLANGYSQLHNIYVDLLGSYGIVFCVLWFVYIFFALRKKYANNELRLGIEFWAGLSLFFFGIFEVSFFNAYGFGTILMLFLLSYAPPSNKRIAYNNIDI